jgi:hypothetical protein
MQDIITSIPWNCGNSDGCNVGWHKSTYWIDDEVETGCTFDEYSDGDHDQCQQSDLPTPEDEQTAWDKYRQHVAATGNDPLGEYGVETTTKTSQTWEVAFRNSIGGVLCCWGRRNRRGPHVRPDDLPDQVRDYLCLVRREGAARNYYFPEGMTQLKREVAEEGCRVIRDRSYLRFVVKVEVSTPRTESAIRRDRVAIAQKGGC